MIPISDANCIKPLWGYIYSKSSTITDLSSKKFKYNLILFTKPLWFLVLINSSFYTKPWKDKLSVIITPFLLSDKIFYLQKAAIEPSSGAWICRWCAQLFVHKPTFIEYRFIHIYKIQAISSINR